MNGLRNGLVGGRQMEGEYVWPVQTVHGQRTGVVLRLSTEEVLKGREMGKKEKVSSRRQVRNKHLRESQSGLNQLLLVCNWARQKPGMRVNSKNRISRSGAEPLQGQIPGARECQDFSRYQNLGT